MIRQRPGPVPGGRRRTPSRAPSRRRRVPPRRSRGGAEPDGPSRSAAPPPLRGLVREGPLDLVRSWSVWRHVLPSLRASPEDGGYGGRGCHRQAGDPDAVTAAAASSTTVPTSVAGPQGSTAPAAMPVRRASAISLRVPLLQPTATTASAARVAGRCAARRVRSGQEGVLAAPRRAQARQQPDRGAAAVATAGGGRLHHAVMAAGQQHRAPLTGGARPRGRSSGPRKGTVGGTDHGDVPARQDGHRATSATVSRCAELGDGSRAGRSTRVRRADQPARLEGDRLAQRGPAGDAGSTREVRRTVPGARTAASSTSRRARGSATRTSQNPARSPTRRWPWSGTGQPQPPPTARSRAPRTTNGAASTYQCRSGRPRPGAPTPRRGRSRGRRPVRTRATG